MYMASLSNVVYVLDLFEPLLCCALNCDALDASYRAEGSVEGRGLVEHTADERSVEDARCHFYYRVHIPLGRDKHFDPRGVLLASLLLRGPTCITYFSCVI